ncbi:MAG TPA: YIP1 family protein [Rubrobacteraceae bacterium]|nr:YIP1 family protein [Rubrobacteraceae bacterium]HLL57289.1 YIP1 family protein [Rubrobacteraceae bacterium]
MDATKSPEFDPKRPVASAAAVLRAIFFAPRRFYSDFSAEGPLREPILFILLVSAVSGVLSIVVNLVSAAVFGSAASLLGVAVSNVAFVVLSPVLIGAAAGAYLLSIRTFIGTEGKFREVYRMLAYAYGAMILFSIPVLNALAFTYATLILMLLGIRSVYRAPFLTALITALAGFVPVALAFIYLLVAVNGLVAR